MHLCHTFYILQWQPNPSSCRALLLMRHTGDLTKSLFAISRHKKWRSLLWYQIQQIVSSYNRCLKCSVRHKSADLYSTPEENILQSQIRSITNYGWPENCKITWSLVLYATSYLCMFDLSQSGIIAIIQQ